MPATTRRPLNVRLPSDILEQIEADGGKKQAIVEDALRAWFSNDSNVLSNDSSENGGGRGDDSTVISDDSSVIAALTGQLGEKDRQIAAKDRQIGELHVLMLQPQLPEAQKAGGWKWWQFWK